MESKLPSHVKIEQPEVCEGQEIPSWSPGSPCHSIQEHSQKWSYDSTDMKVVKQELSDFPCEDGSHRYSEVADIAEGSVIQEMTEHSNSESGITTFDSSCKASVKHENSCQMSKNVSCVVDTKNELSLAISCVSSHRTHTGDVSDVSSPNVCVHKNKRTHIEGMPMTFNECDDVSIQDDHLECQKNMNNQRSPTGEKSYKCGVCDASFTQAVLLKTHEITHAGERPYKCDICGASFTQACSLKTHKRIHTGEKPYKCEDCGASFTLADHLKTHNRIHTLEKPYKCDVCGASFTQVGSLKRHERTHTGEKPYNCDVCSASFAEAGSLKKHKRTHTGEKPYKCEVCRASFALLGSLKEHQRTHTGEKPYICDVCGASFTQAGSVKRHKRTHTGEKP